MASELRWLLGAGWIILAVSQVANASEAEDHFEKKIRPLLVERCHKCHAGDALKGGLRLDSREATLRGGESGAAVVAGDPEKSLLLQAVRHQNGLAMPPDGKLTETQIADLTQWIKSGAVWPGDSSAPMPPGTDIEPAPPYNSPRHGSLADALQLWLAAESLSLNDGESAPIWPDRSGNGRDVTATKGVRADGVGLPGTFIKHSTLMRRPAVRFETTTGYAASPDRPVDIHGDAGLTILLIVNLTPHETKPQYDGVFGIGNPANPGGDPGRPLAAVVQINRVENHALQFAGGWNHHASLGTGSFQPYYGKPVMMTVIKRPGPMRSTTQIFLNGIAAQRAGGEPLEGRDTIPEIQHRSDIGAFLGKAVGWCGAIQGDVGEVIVYNKPLDEPERLGVEGYLVEKYGLLSPVHQRIAPAAQFTPEERQFWAYRPVQNAPPPAVHSEPWVQTPVDRFVLAKLESLGISPAPVVDKVTWLRRVTFDLTGLPPTPEEVAAFIADSSSPAYEQAVNRLLESPHYGERWARHWLDVVRYAESTANDANAVMRYAWRYRNYVIDAFNRDLPYDQFLIEQLAGDLLPADASVEVNTRRIVATGYLMIGPKALAETDKEQSRLDIVDDQIDVTGRAMLGLTLACARCHDHKFDAIRTTDYYALAGIFRSTEPFQNEVRNASMWWEFPVAQGPGAEPLVVMAPKEAAPKNLRVHIRGNRFSLGAVVPRGFLQNIESVHDSVAPIAPNQLASGRLELARWIASPSNPLTARVKVNRIWQHHFGRGLVATSDNFGVRGERPSHPELLDWLAARFVESGWSIKAMHRLIVLSNAYRQSSLANPASRDADPEGTWLSSFPRRRLSAEEIRDAMLAVSGKLDPAPGTQESGEFLVSKAENIGAMIMPNRVVADDPFYTDFPKRSIYLPVVRNMLPDVLALFDAADPNGVTAQRNETTVASQSLFLLNSPFVRNQSRAFAERLFTDVSLTDEGRIELAHQLAFGRAPTSAEMADSLGFLQAYLASSAAQARPEAERRLSAWQGFCQTLLCSNEFLYVE
ncbi:MAG: PSD1 and planctomycete cytochrome C domain-containing protein [Planctomycetaceae bacterium]